MGGGPSFPSDEYGDWPDGYDPFKYGWPAEYTTTGEAIPPTGDRVNGHTSPHVTSHESDVVNLGDWPTPDVFTENVRSLLRVDRGPFRFEVVKSRRQLTFELVCVGRVVRLSLLRPLR